MTVNELQKCLIKEIEQITKEMSFLDCERNPASMKGYPQAIPIFSVFRETDSIDEGVFGRGQPVSIFCCPGQTALSIRQTIKTGKEPGPDHDRVCSDGRRSGYERILHTDCGSGTSHRTISEKSISGSVLVQPPDECGLSGR